MNEHALLYEYAVIRYVPRVERGEFVNVGLMMMCKRRRWLRTAIHIDEPRLRAFDPQVDIDSLRRQLAMFDAASPTLADNPVEERFRWLSAVKSSVLQTSRPHPGLAPCETPPGTTAEATARLDETFERLLADLVL